MTNNNDKKKNSFWEGVKKGAGCAVGAGIGWAINNLR